MIQPQPLQVLTNIELYIYPFIKQELSTKNELELKILTRFLWEIPMKIPFNKDMEKI